MGIYKTGIDVVSYAPWGTHLCQFYQSKQDLIDILVPYFKKGLSENEFCMWVTSEPMGVEEAREVLASVEPAYDDFVRRGQIEILDYTQWYTYGGSFNADSVLQGWIRKLKSALDRGFDGLRLTGNTFWIENQDWADFTAYEEAVNRVIGKYRMMALCTYCLDRCGAHEIIDVVSNHQFALIKLDERWRMIESSEHQKTEAALRESEERLTRTQAIARLGSWEFDIATSRLAWSDEAFRIFGIQPSIPAMTYETFIECVHPDDRTAVDSAYFGSLQEGKNSFEFDHRIFRKDTKELRYLHEKCEHVLDADGTTVRSIGMVHDITERKQAEERIIRQNLALSGITRLFHEALNSRNEEELGKICLAVAEEITQSAFGFIGEINRKTGKLDDISISDPGWRLCRMQDQSGHGRRAPFEFEIQGIYGRILFDGRSVFTNDPGSHPDSIGLPGGHPPLNAFLGVPLFHAGEVVGMVGLGNRADGYGPEELYLIEAIAPAIVQVFANKRAEERLRATRDNLETHVKERTAELENRAAQLARLTKELTLAEQRERNRIADILHEDLQQLMVAAKLGLEELTPEIPGDKKSKATRILDLIAKSIQMSRSLTAELSPPVLYNGAFSTAVKWLTEWMAENHGLAVELRVDPGFDPVRKDLKILLFQSIRELLLNVVKHAKVSSACIEIVREKGTLCICVSDQGVGLDPESTWKSISTGSVFGLFSIRERLMLLGGALNVESEPGKGSRFSLIIPVLKKIPPEKLKPVQPPAPGSIYKAEQRVRNEDEIRVLIVDDHPVMREGLSSLLTSQSDIEVVGEASNGEEAVLMARKIVPDVILMDIKMPKMNGFEATRIIHSEFPHIRIIGLSMFEEEEQVAAMLDAGASTYLSKSGNTDLLIPAIRKSDDQVPRPLSSASSRLKHRTSE